MASRAARALVVLVGALAFATLAGPAAAALPRPAHVVIVIDENQAFTNVIGNAAAPWLSALARTGAVFADAHGVTHPSQPNYLALFAGVTNVNGNACEARGFARTAPNVASELLAAGLTFAAYSESLPHAGFMGCSAGALYARKHAPWTQFVNLPQQLHRPFATFPAYPELPAVSFVVPNLRDDMHDRPVREGDVWAQLHLGPLVRWAQTHDTLLVFTWDEGFDATNTVPTFFAGPMVKPGRYPERIDHYRVLRTIEALYGLAPTGRAARVAPITDIWK
jgi:acid phosphatase